MRSYHIKHQGVIELEFEILNYQNYYIKGNTFEMDTNFSTCSFIVKYCVHSFFFFKLAVS